MSKLAFITTTYFISSRALASSKPDPSKIVEEAPKQSYETQTELEQDFEKLNADLKNPKVETSTVNTPTSDEVIIHFVDLTVDDAEKPRNDEINPLDSTNVKLKGYHINLKIIIIIL